MTRSKTSLSDLKETGRQRNEPSSTFLGPTESGRIEFPSGAKRDDAERNVAFHLLCPAALHAYARTAKEGELHYGPRNWEKGIPTENYIDHAMEHLIWSLAGGPKVDHHERYTHLSHALWNIAAAIHNETECTHHVWED